MKISCIIPTCDRLNLLLESIKTILDQSYSPYEIIIINNGKEKIVLPEDILQKVKVFEIMPYAGVAQARNFGAFLASGDYLAFLDDDDLWNKNYLENIAKEINNGSKIIVSRLDTLTLSGKIEKCKNAYGKMEIKNFLISNPGVTGSNLVISKDIFYKIKGYNIKLWPPSEDKSIVLDALINNYSVAVLNDNQAIMRDHGGSRLTDSAKIAEGIKMFIYIYKDKMNFKELIINWKKVYKHRILAGKKIYFIHFILLASLYKIIK